MFSSTTLATWARAASTVWLLSLSTETAWPMVCMDETIWDVDIWMVSSPIWIRLESTRPFSASRVLWCMASMAWLAASWTARMRRAMSRADLADRSASRRISSATTPKPRPCCPARAASMAALMARMWVRSATSSMAWTMTSISAARSPMRSMRWLARCTDRAMAWRASVAWATVVAPSMAAAPASLAIRRPFRAAFSTWAMAAASFSSWAACASRRDSDWRSAPKAM